MKMFTVAAFAVGLTIAGATGAGAAPIAGLFNTGVDATGFSTPQASHAVDLHWTLIDGPSMPNAYTGGTNGIFPIGPWLTEDSVSRWITPTADASQSWDPGPADGVYHYTMIFTLPQISAAMFSGRYAVDNAVDRITLNGNTIGGPGGGFTAWTGFGATSGFTQGANTLTFTVRNFNQNGGNPSGLRVEFGSSDFTAGIPEPMTWALMIMGFGGVGAVLRRRRTAAAFA